MSYHPEITDLIRRRRSWRSYGGQPLEPEQRDALARFFNSLETPFWGNAPRFELVDVGHPGRGRMPGTYGVIKGAGVFLVGAVKRGRRDMEDFGFLFEKIVLYATELGLGTCWIGLTFARMPLAERIHLEPDETIPAVSPLGYPAPSRSVLDAVTRAGVGATKRKPWPNLFFDRTWGAPLSKQAAGAYEVPLEMVRLGPSATNNQPWRVVRHNGAWHFFLRRAPGYARVTSAADLQRIDMGIAMCHFEMAARALSLGGGWAEADIVPEPPPKRCEYIVSWVEG